MFSVNQPSGRKRDRTKFTVTPGLNAAFTECTFSPTTSACEKTTTRRVHSVIEQQYITFSGIRVREVAYHEPTKAHVKSAVLASFRTIGLNAAFERGRRRVQPRECRQDRVNSLFL